MMYSMHIENVKKIEKFCDKRSEKSDSHLVHLELCGRSVLLELSEEAKLEDIDDIIKELEEIKRKIQAL